MVFLAAHLIIAFAVFATVMYLVKNNLAFVNKLVDFDDIVWLMVMCVFWEISLPFMLLSMFKDVILGWLNDR